MKTTVCRYDMFLNSGTRDELMQALPTFLGCAQRILGLKRSVVVGAKKQLIWKEHDHRLHCCLERLDGCILPTSKKQNEQGSAINRSQRLLVVWPTMMHLMGGRCLKVCVLTSFAFVPH